MYDSYDDARRLPPPVVAPGAKVVLLDPRTVKVRLVWPAERGAKEDCKANTRTVWTGHGDVQDFPAELWSKLAPHPDVWQLADPADSRTAQEAAQASYETAEQKVARLNEASRATREAAMARTESDRLAAEAARSLGAETATDVVLTLPALLSAAQIAALSDEDVHVEARKRGFGLHPRLSPVNLRVRFLQSQADLNPVASDTTLDVAGLPVAGTEEGARAGAEEDATLAAVV